MEEKNEPQTDKEILNDVQDGIFNSLYGKKAKRRKFFKKHSSLLTHAKRVLIIPIVVYSFVLTCKVIIAAPSYSDEETIKNEAALLKMIDEKGGVTRDRFLSSLKLLKESPAFYRKVVNNIDELEVRDGICDYACVRSSSSVVLYNAVDFMAYVVSPDANFNKKILTIDPTGFKHFDNDVEFASMIVHETDHVEYLESSRLRRGALAIHCNPIINPHISVYSGIPDISHRIQTIEICAEKAQIDFHEASLTHSSYDTESNIFGVLFGGLFGAMKDFIGMFF
ncbi:MAG: hypothetical protein PF572_04110 [Patescibacteria group bacterium]|jgi:hypothetical protein|nr:hypothetical protein [Patescibacteria group bacterium]